MVTDGSKMVLENGGTRLFGIQCGWDSWGCKDIKVKVREPMDTGPSLYHRGGMWGKRTSPYILKVW